MKLAVVIPTSCGIPAKAGISGREVTDLLHETPAFAGATA
jgi:hypothetical protein